MNTNLIAPAIFYLSILIYVICLYRHGGFKIIFSNFEMLKYNIGTTLFFFLNINVLFFCSFCGHCHHVCIPFTLSAVTIGLVVYLTHLGKQTISAIKHIIAGEEFDFMAPFFSIPYFVLIYEIVNAMLNAGLESLHAFESKMLIVLLYPFFVAVGELTSRIKKAKGDAENKKQEATH
jgi:ABC-type Fe3+-siderophore transport system permease subunit